MIVLDPESPSGISRQFKSKIKHVPVTFNGQGYARVWRDGRLQMLHRVIWELHHGTIPEGLEIDHINRDHTDNRIENLRLATRSEQNLNRGNWGKLPKYITTVKGRFFVQFQTQPKLRKTFDTLEEAVEFRDKEVTKRALRPRQHPLQA